MAVGGCSSGSEATLDGTWTVTEANPEPLVDGSTITLTFADGGVHGSDGCNTISATDAHFSVGRLRVSALRSTKMACPGAVGDQAAWFDEMLGQAPSAQLTQTQLILVSATRRVVLTRS